MQIRTGMRSSWLAAAAAVLVTGLLAFLPSGCGGGGETIPGSEPTPVGATPTPTPLRTAAFKVKIDWGARSRVVGLSSALSARITLEGGDPAGGDISWVVNRPAGTAAILQSYDSPRPAKVGNFVLRVRFFINSDATGDEVGEAAASATILADGSLTVTIATYTGVQTVEVLPNQAVEVGAIKDLAVGAKNAKGTPVAITRGSMFFTVVADTSNLEVVNGGASVRGLHPIQATVTVQVDQATSAPTVVQVTSGTAVTVVPGSSDNLGSEFPLDLVATVTGAPTAESDVVWSIQGGASATTGQLLNVTGTTVTYVAPKLIGGAISNIVVVATSKYNSTKTFPIPIKVTAPAVVEITPPTVGLSWEQSVSLTALVKNLSPRIPATGDSRREVKWEIVKDGNNPVGVLVVDPTDANKVTYTAPKREATITIRAISNYDATKIGVCTITVLSAVGVTIAPSPAPQLNWDDTLNLTAAVSNTPNQGVTWSIVSPAGFGSAIASTGSSTARFTAPKNNATYTVRATSVYDTRKFMDLPITVLTTIGVVVTAPNPLPDPQKVSISRTQNFAVALTGLPTGRDGTVSWTITGPNGEANTGNVYGSIISTGATTAAYTAPGTPPAANSGLLKVIATSNYDTNAKKTINVQVIAGSLGVRIN
ncbi:hypothetical protein [Armatimonas sp.]|uniref:hypothetical protein n=1 Tax=Armatimonas sp. TaxID=1872638 RepID=UPI0037520C37